MNVVEMLLISDELIRPSALQTDRSPLLSSNKFIIALT